MDIVGRKAILEDDTEVEIVSHIEGDAYHVAVVGQPEISYDLDRTEFTVLANEDQ